MDKEISEQFVKVYRAMHEGDKRAMGCSKIVLNTCNTVSRGMWNEFHNKINKTNEKIMNDITWIKWFMGAFLIPIVLMTVKILLIR